MYTYTYVYIYICIVVPPHACLVVTVAVVAIPAVGIMRMLWRHSDECSIWLDAMRVRRVLRSTSCASCSYDVAISRAASNELRRPSYRLPLRLFGAVGANETEELKIHQRGVQWKQGVVICMLLNTSLLYNNYYPHPLHPPPTAPPCNEYPTWGIVTHRWNRTPRPRPQTFSKLMSLITFS